MESIDLLKEMIEKMESTNTKQYEKILEILDAQGKRITEIEIVLRIKQGVQEEVGKQKAWIWNNIGKIIGYTIVCALIIDVIYHHAPQMIQWFL